MNMPIAIHVVLSIRQGKYLELLQGVCTFLAMYVLCLDFVSLFREAYEKPNRGINPSLKASLGYITGALQINKSNRPKNTFFFLKISTITHCWGQMELHIMQSASLA